ncbi:MAG TPA: two-component regulator propeller domain-containing protein [Thermoanaerobaculia bacterium]|nr:two-component regulator propeller domain-containing protein [Thermoanaerobaculia bacterium]
MHRTFWRRETTSGDSVPWRAALALLAALAFGKSAFATDAARALTQLRFSVWTSDSGLPQNTVDAIVQTRDGYLWIGTEEGLARFDGVRFVVSDRQSAPALRSSFVSSLFEGPDGTLWIGTYGGGLARLRNGRIEAFHPELLGTDRLRGMHATADGGIFIATAGGGLLRIDGEKVTRFTTRDGLPTDRIWALEGDGAGGLWIATHGGGVVRWRGRGVQQRLTTREGLPNDFARALLRDRDGTLWIGTDGGGLAAWRDGAIVRVLTTRDGLPSNLIRSLQRDHDGNLWIGTDGGLARWRGVRADAFGVAEGLPSPIVRAVVEDREGSLWVGTTGGLVRLSDTRFLSFTRKEGLPIDGVRPILEDRTGRIWVGTEGGGLCTILPAPVRCFTKNDGLPHDTVYALAESRDGSLWIGTDGGGVARLRDGRVEETIDARSGGLPTDRVRALVETADGGLWVSTTAGLAHVRDWKAIRVKELDDRQLRPLLALPDGSLLVGTDGAGLWRVSERGAPATRIAEGLESNRVFSLAADAEGSGVWIGTSGGGLARLDLATGAVRSLTRRDGLYDDVVFQVVDEGTGRDLWLTSNRGLFRVERNQVLAAMQRKSTGTASDLSGTVYGTTDGMPSAECNAGFPAAIRARNGRLWVATARGVAVIDPRASSRNTIPPQVHVEEVLIDGIPASAAPGTKGPLRVPPATQRLELRYTALSLRAPERVTFRYMLEGYDRDWVEAGANRVAHFTKLAPGDYTFRVAATNEDGVRSDGEARLGVTVDPRWFETWWARLLAIALIAAAIWGAVRLRLAALRARKNEELARAYEDVRRIAAELEDTNRQLAVANVRLRALSYVDGLTGVANRRRFDEALEEAWSTAISQGEPVSLVLIDLDHFKKLNDSQGHQEGDEALRAVATLLAEQTDSRGGLAARFGGEEFAWLLPGVSLEEAKAEAEAFRRVVREAAIRHAGADSGIVTASLGVSSSAGMEALTPLALVAAADAALYRAKAGGRDRVEGEESAPAA